MQVTQAKIAGQETASIKKTLTICVNSTLVVLKGNWHWEMQSEAVYCSDVIYFPADFEGTKAIIHPDDIANLTSALSLLTDEAPLELAFRIFTTYGEIKKITGEGVSISRQEDEMLEAPQTEPWEAATQVLANRKETETLQQLQQLAEVAERIHDTGTWLINKSTKEVYYSNNIFRIHGLPAQSLNAHPYTFYSFIHPDERTTVTEVLEKAYTEELPVQLEYRILKPNGEVRYVQLVTQWSFTKNGQHLLQAVLKDVSDQQEQEQQQATREAYFRMQKQTLQYAENLVSAGSWHMDMITRKTTFSDNYLRLFGLKPSQEITSHSSILELVHPEDIALVKESLEKLYREHAMPETLFRIIRPDGNIRYLRQSGKVITRSASEMFMMGVAVDVTAQTLLEKKIQAYKEKTTLHKTLYNLTESKSDLGSIIWHLPDESMTWSEGIYTLFGLKNNAAEPRLQLLQKSVHPGDQNTFLQGVRLALNGEPVDDLLLRIHAKGSMKQVKLSFQQVTANDKTAIIGLVQDVTAPLFAEQQLLDERKVHQLLSDSVNECAILTDTNHTIIKWNRQAEEKTGIKKSEALFWNFFEVFPLLKEADYMDQLQAALIGETIKGVKSNGGYLNKTHVYTLTPHKNERGEVTSVLHLVNDISKEQELEERLYERLNFIENLVESSVDRIVVLDRNMNYLYWNHRAEAYYGILKKEVLGRNILEVFPGFRDDPTYKEFRRALQGEIVHIPAAQNLKAKKGYFETYLIPVKNKENAVSGILWIVHDLLNEFMLQQQQKRAVEILNIVNAVFIELDDEYRIIFVNSTAETYLNKNREALLGKVLWEIFPQETDAIGCDAVVEANTKGIRADVEYFSVVYNRWIFMSVSPTETGVILLQYDRQHVKEAEQKVERSRHWMQQTAQASPDAILIFDLKTRQPTYLNNCLAEWLGITTDELESSEKAERTMFVHPDDLLKLLHFGEELASATDGVVLTLEYRMETENGHILWVRNRSKVFERDATGNVTHVLSILQNITEEKAVDEELKNMNVSLEKISHELENKNEEITSFAYIASHDLREPLRKIQTFGNWLLDREENNLSASGKDYLNKMSAAAKRMSLMIDDILMLSRVMSSDIAVEAVDLNKVVRSAEAALAASIESTATTIKTEALPEVTGNEQQLVQLFANLLSNAIRFQQSGSKPHIVIKAETVTGASVAGAHLQPKSTYHKISLIDNGIGFEQKHAHQIFHVFQRLNGRHEYPGTGMGLAICKKIMENHHGCILAESKPGRGAVFSCYFPVSQGE